VYLEKLSSIASRLTGVLALSLVDRDGMPIESFNLDEELDLETLAAEMVGQLRLMNDERSGFSLGAIRHISLTSEKFSVLLTQVAPGYFLLLVLEPNQPLGHARFELRKAALSFEGELI
jgi:predicted regulator of Ras-like GTPase activity (Roadblock/LC7/MglB family)